jgi:hypothetical protein
MSGSGKGADGEQTLIGATPNLAARLQALAEPGAVIVSAVTHRLTSNFFEYLFVGEHALKGYDEPVAAWRALSESAVETRFGAARRADAEPIVGRERELALLADSWERATRGNGHLVLFTGEPGIGKSRLVESFAERIQERSHRLLRCQCSPHHRNSALYPFTQLLRRRMDIRPDLPPAENLRRVDGMLARIGRSGRVPQLLVAELLEIAAPDALSPMEMTQVQRKSETLAILEAFLLAPLEGAAVLLLLEDAHWSDPTTRSLIDRLLKRVDREHALVLVTQRPELETDWPKHANATLVSCKPLARELCAELIRRVTATAQMDEAVIGQIVARSDGVPLYLEEIAKAVLDMRSAQPKNVPLTLQDSLAARLDRLGKAKQVAQVASVIGRQFSLALLAAIADESDEALREAIDRLKASGLVFGTESEDGADYCFNHSLVQEAAYESLARERRQALHARIAQLLDSGIHAESEAVPALIAFHCSRAGEPERAVGHWLRAAQFAATRVAYAEAIASLGSALEDAARVADPAVRARMTLEIQLKLGQVHISRSGPGTVEARAALQEAYALAKAAPPGPQLFQATWGLYLDAASNSEVVRAKSLGEELLAISDALGDENLQYEALHHRWGLALFTGRIADLLDFTRQGIDRYDRGRHHALSNVFAGHDAGVCAYFCYAVGLAQAGRMATLSPTIDAALTLARELEHPVTLAFGLQGAATTTLTAGDYESCRRHAGQLVEMAERYDFAPYRTFAQFVLAAAQSLGGEPTAGLEQMAVHFERAVAFRFAAGYPNVAMAEALARAGRDKEALETVTRALVAMQQPETGIFVPDLWRLRGELTLRIAPAEAAAAERYLELANRIAAAQGARVSQLRSALALARLLAAQGRNAQGAAALASALDGPLEWTGAEVAEARKLKAELER